MRSFLAIFLLCAFAAAAATGEPRIALVIGNQSYKDSPLLNPVNDAKAVAASLRTAGFEVIERHDQNAADMRRAIREFGERLRGKGAGVFYFAGHGVQVKGRNFLVPVNSDIKYEDEIEDQSVDIGLVLSKMESAKARINLVILDACRNNPFARNARSAQNGLAPMEAPIGTLIAFATSPGQVASDGRGANGLYTEHLVREMSQSGLKVEDVFKRVRAGVRQASAGRQIPWENTSLEGDFYFRQPERVDMAALERERRQKQEEAIRQAVADALTRSKEESEREKRRLEQFYAEKLEAERQAARREALERVAAIEKTAREAVVRASARAELSPAVVPSSQPAVAAAAPVQPPVETKPDLKPAAPPASPESTAASLSAPPSVVAPADLPEPLGQAAEAREETPASFMLALGLDTLDSKIKPISEQVARGLVPAKREQGDRWVFYRQQRDGQGVTRRNYMTLTVTDSNERGYTTSSSTAEVLARYDASGNQLAEPVSQGRAIMLHEPYNPLYRFPLEPGDSWSLKSTERQPGLMREVDSVVTVVGWESVQVPAGTFRAMKITKVANRFWEPFPGQHMRSKRVSNIWYVPGVRHFARYEAIEVANNGNVLMDQTWELDSFKLN